MKDTESLHKKVQEMCDCYATSDPLREMSVVKNDADRKEAALKWLGLAALHGVNNNAEKITVRRSPDGQVAVVAKYRESQLPSPGPDVGGEIFQTVREITHIEGEKGKTALALGIRDSSIDLTVKIKSKDNEQKVTIKFP